MWDNAGRGGGAFVVNQVSDIDYFYTSLNCLNNLAFHYVKELMLNLWPTIINKCPLLAIRVFSGLRCSLLCINDVKCDNFPFIGHMFYAL